MTMSFERQTDTETQTQAHMHLPGVENVVVLINFKPL